MTPHELEIFGMRLQSIAVGAGIVEHQRLLLPVEGTFQLGRQGRRLDVEVDGQMKVPANGL